MKLYFLTIFLAIVVCINFVYATASSISKHKRLHKLTQTIYFGAVYNESSIPIQVTDYKTIKIILPGQNSLEIGIKDVDSIIISQPTYIDNKVYVEGVFKFCDLATIKISDFNNLYKISYSKKTNICKAFNDFHIYKTLKEAFPQKGFNRE